MDFSLGTAEVELAALARRILADHATPDRLRAVEAGEDRFDRTLWTRLADAGVLAAALPEAVGGAGLDLLAQCAVLVELGRAVAPVPYLPSVVLGAAALARFGQPDLACRAAQGELIVTAALVEADGEPPVWAERAAGGWVLSGARTAVPAGPYADLILVPAGGHAFLVTPTDPGVTMRPQRVVDGDREGLLDLAGVAVPDDRVLGGREVLDWLIARGTVGVCAAQLGVVERALELTAEYARTRVQFGRPIGEFQAVAQRLADGYIDVEAVRLTMWQAAWRLSADLPAETEVATAKFWAADAGHRVAHTAVHVHGGVGIDMEHPLHRYFVAAKRGEFTLGAATAQLRRIGAALADAP
jgi:alkylation response protein AidB-like acyl-CoA dehydrogenase